ncbi:MAG: NAD(P)/FAD-dependent oxidoreductase [Bacillota bacterium]
MKIIVIGGGASGLFCSGHLASKGHDVILLEQGDAFGKKILITGNGRCNLTNLCDKDEFLRNIPKNPKFLYPSLEVQSPEDTVQWFVSHGLPTKVEEKNRVLPKSERASDVVDCLVAFCEKNGVKCNLNEKVNEIIVENERVSAVVTTKNTHLAEAVVVATGGLSFPKTGSTGDGYRFAETMGHTIAKPVASLVALETNEKNWDQLMGVSLQDVKVTLWQGEKAVLHEVGDVMCTHFGVSAPLIFTLSAHMKENKSYRLTVDFQREYAIEQLEKKILEQFMNEQKKELETLLQSWVPKKIALYLIETLAIPPHTKVNHITKEQRQALVMSIKKFPIAITQKRPIAEATITRGGVSVKEIDPKTMQSKKVSGAYFIGEVLDLDGYTGGFNLQIAWATAVRMARSFESHEV